MTISRPCYCSREMVKRALDIQESARANGQVDRAIEAAAGTVEGCLHRRFHPWIGTRYFDWPPRQASRPWRLWLDGNDLISVSAIVVAGTALTAGEYFLRRSDDRDEPPYTHVEINLATSAAFDSGTTHQRQIAITGVYGGNDTAAPAGVLDGLINSSVTTVNVTNSAAMGVGDLVKVDSEYLLVTDKAMVDTGVNIDAADSLLASKSDVSITMSTTTKAPAVDETILIGSERMLVVDVAGSVLTVVRAYDGTVLATHAGSADIYAPRALTVTRGAVGSTAASHADTAALTRHVPPPLVRDLSTAYALNQVLQETSGYARVAGSGDSQREFTGRGLKDIEEAAWTAHGRKARKKAI